MVNSLPGDQMPLSAAYSSNDCSADLTYEADVEEEIDKFPRHAPSCNVRQIRSYGVFKSLLKMVVGMLRDGTGTATEIAIYFFFNLRGLAARCEANRNLLIENETSSLILDNFEHLGKLSEEVMKLLVFLGRHHLGRTEFRVYLAMFKRDMEDGIKLALLQGLSDIAELSRNA
jgi:hypothetical protein